MEDLSITFQKKKIIINKYILFENLISIIFYLKVNINLENINKVLINTNYSNQIYKELIQNNEFLDIIKNSKNIYINGKENYYYNGKLYNNTNSIINIINNKLKNIKYKIKKSKKNIKKLDDKLYQLDENREKLKRIYYLADDFYKNLDIKDDVNITGKILKINIYDFIRDIDHIAYMKNLKKLCITGDGFINFGYYFSHQNVHPKIDDMLEIMEHKLEYNEKYNYPFKNLEYLHIEGNTRFPITNLIPLLNIKVFKYNDKEFTGYNYINYIIANLMYNIKSKN